MKIEVTVNGALHALDVPPIKRMLDVIREDLGLTGAKEGCGEGECGACAVLMDGKLVDTCLIPAIQMAGREILTIEGLGSQENLDDLQRIFLEEGAVHCGFCTPAMIMAGRGLIESNPNPTDEEIRVGIAGNICRCTGYEKIVNAVNRAAKEGYGAKIKRRPNLCKKTRPEFTDAEAKKYFAPATLAEALDMMDANEDITVLAGGTDIGPGMKSGKFDPAKVIDLFDLPELKGIEVAGDCIRIGSCVSNGDIIASPVAREYLPALVIAAGRSGALAIQNRATIGGNVVTASGAGDLPVVLLALAARAVVAGKNGEREMELDAFITGYRKTALAHGEILKELRVPMPAAGSRQIFYKRGSRKALTLSRASLAMYLYAEDGVIKTFRAAAGSMSPVPIRLKNFSAAMPGKTISPELADEAYALASGDVNPRKSPQYRKAMVGNLAKRFFSELAQ